MRGVYFNNRYSFPVALPLEFPSPDRVPARCHVAAVVLVTVQQLPF